MVVLTFDLFINNYEPCRVKTAWDIQILSHRFDDGIQKQSDRSSLHRRTSNAIMGYRISQ